MTTKKSKTPKSKHPYQRRTSSEMIRVLHEIEQGTNTILGACIKYGINRNTLKLWKSKLAMRTLGLGQSASFLDSMNENQKSKAVYDKLREVTKALERSELKVFALETAIKVAEEDLKNKIRKKSGTKQSKG